MHTNVYIKQNHWMKTDRTGKGNIPSLVRFNGQVFVRREMKASICQFPLTRIKQFANQNKELDVKQLAQEVLQEIDAFEKEQLAIEKIIANLSIKGGKTDVANHEEPE